MRLSHSSDGGLDRYARGLEQLAAGGWEDPVSDAVGEALVDLVEEQFATGRGPDGAPHKATKRGNVPLLGATLQLSTSTRFERAPGPGVDIIVADEKAVYHQRPRSGRIPQRRMLPDGEPAQWWTVQIRVSASEAFGAYARAILGVA